MVGFTALCTPGWLAVTMSFALSWWAVRYSLRCLVSPRNLLLICCYCVGCCSYSAFVRCFLSAGSLNPGPSSVWFLIASRCLSSTRLFISWCPLLSKLNARQEWCARCPPPSEVCSPSLKPVQLGSGLIASKPPVGGSWGSRTVTGWALIWSGPRIYILSVISVIASVAMADIVHYHTAHLHDGLSGDYDLHMMLCSTSLLLLI